jgi:O-antigen ligase
VTGRPALLVFILAATLAAFGGIYSWTLPPIVVGALLFALLTWRPGRDIAPDTRALDWTIAASIAVIAIQIVPIPWPARSLLSPNLATAERALRPDGLLRTSPSGPLSIDPSGTWEAFGLVVAVALTYLGARSLFRTRGVRQVCWWLGAIGAVAGIAAIVQRAITPGLIYGFWQPRDAGAMPFGPVVNRNHFAAWLLMASAVTAGYLIARVARRMPADRAWRSRRRVVIGVAQSSVGWTAACLAVMLTTLAVTQSRSAIVGTAVAAAVLIRTLSRTWKPVLLALAGVLVIGAGLMWAGESTTTRLANRFAETLETRDVSRLVIWRESLPMVRDFPFTGVGAGGFGRAMLAYQQTRAFAPHLGMEWHFNHAHNHYLQVLVEGGILLAVPLVVLTILFVNVVRRRLREDEGELRSVRIGAVAGLAGIATQSLWEVPLTMPAAALLAATLAALATYQRGPSGFWK